MPVRIFILLFVLLGLVSCAARGPLYTQYQSKNSASAVVYIYRPSKAVNCCVAPTIYINNEKKDSLKNGGYTVYELPPGKYVMTVGDGTHGFDVATLHLDIKQHEQYYLKWAIGSLENVGEVVLSAMVGAGGAMPGKRGYNLVQMETGIAKKEIKSLRLSAPSNRK